MKFRTEYVPLPSPLRLSPERPVVMLGSCFSDNIAARMRQSLWQAVNPAGTLYNPLSIAASLQTMLGDKEGEKRFRASIFTDESGKFRSFLGDYRFASFEKIATVFKWKAARKKLIDTLENADALFITFGTSICYSLLPEDNGETLSSSERSREEILASTVANCHKLPASRFERFRLTVEEIASVWIPLCREMRGRFPNLNVVFTVSPVRHVKDGFVGNMRSKAVLQLAVEQICDALDFCSYFPAYEILYDDLRDYRFYASDLVHPSEQAVEYIWDIFKQTYLDREALDLLKEGEKIVKGYNHRPLTASAHERAEYEREMQRRYDDFCRRHPFALKECFSDK